MWTAPQQATRWGRRAAPGSIPAGWPPSLRLDSPQPLLQQYAGDDLLGCCVMNPGSRLPELRVRSPREPCAPLPPVSRARRRCRCRWRQLLPLHALAAHGPAPLCVCRLGPMVLDGHAPPAALRPVSPAPIETSSSSCCCG